jgi:hypothetical protein
MAFLTRLIVKLLLSLPQLKVQERMPDIDDGECTAQSTPQVSPPAAVVLFHVDRTICTAEVNAGAVLATGKTIAATAAALLVNEPSSMVMVKEAQTLTTSRTCTMGALIHPVALF